MNDEIKDDFSNYSREMEQFYKNFSALTKKMQQELKIFSNYQKKTKKLVPPQN